MFDELSRPGPSLFRRDPVIRQIVFCELIEKGSVEVFSWCLPLGDFILALIRERLSDHFLC